jgi:hypothetical protein
LGKFEGKRIRDRVCFFISFVMHLEMLAVKGFFRISFPKQKETLAKKVLGSSK